MAETDRRRFLIAATQTAIGLAAGSRIQPLAAQEANPVEGVTIDLALVLAADCSGSVSADEYTLQQQGYADAFRQAEVIKAIRSGSQAGIMVCYLQWSGYDLQQLVLPWTLLRSDESIAAFAQALELSERRLQSGGTAPAGAIRYGSMLLDEVPAKALRKVIDVSGDGRTNTGPSTSEDRESAIARGITINGLPILHLEADIEDYYRHHVIGGPGAFLVAARDFDAFKEAVRRKLVLEIAGLQPSTG